MLKHCVVECTELLFLLLTEVRTYSSEQAVTARLYRHQVDTRSPATTLTLIAVKPEEPSVTVNLINSGIPVVNS
jgi:hypothetical protein